ncbi:hypothetical protein CROQUDRAFT_668245 [Cronartium quercuum f. sp. fusiforme G11]|uniref:Uncharacterized protein n=1 Tax=Cronartium quercuum f. sp. fusiforme G11 TaxID=708437 RepID=A0A9P6NPH1_9BASI|nr:hypothetical protein CROQUDRAFT_668245 [Cronartium quercuum f. sp. fusiforme G11]
MILTTRAFLFVLFSITSFNLASPSMLSNTAETVESLSRSSSKLKNIELEGIEHGTQGTPKGPEPGDRYIHLFPKKEEVQDIPRTEPTTEEGRLQYGQSWGPGGVFAKWIWSHILRPVLVTPVERLWGLLKKPIIGIPNEKMANRELQMLVDHVKQQVAAKQGKTELETTLEEAKEDVPPKKSGTRFNLFQLFKSKQETPQADVEKEELLKGQKKSEDKVDSPPSSPHSPHA